MKRTLALLICAVTIFCISCGAKEYKNDVAVKDVCDAVTNSVKFEKEMSTAAESYVKFTLKLDTANISEYEIRYTGGTNLDEFGVFKVKDSSNIADVQSMISDYLESRAGNTVELSYFPGEETKVTNAKVLTYGYYVVYLMVADDYRSAAENAIESCLKK